MAQTTSGKVFRAGFFKTVAAADRAVRGLLAKGFPRDDLAVIVPPQLRDQFTPDVPRAERPGSHAAEAVVAGGALGATLGGIALAATAIATGGVGLLPALPVLVGGGALAGGFSSLIVSDGYGKGIGEYYEEAVQHGEIVVGVQFESEENVARIAEAERVLAEAGAEAVEPTGSTEGAK